MTSGADHDLAGTLLGVLLRPGRTFEGLRTQRRSSAGAAPIALLGMLWGLLCFLLWASGRPAPFVLLPLSPRTYYLVEGLFMLPILTGLYWIFSEIAHRLAAGEGSEPATRTALGFAYAAPLMLHVGAEILAYLFGGPGALSLVGRVTLPLAGLWVLALSALALRRIHRISARRAGLAALVGLLVQAAAGALVLR